jgi:uncharacterized LabA/DUF88 family protein
MKNINQRVGVFVDVSNLYHSAKNIYQSRVNFAELIKTAVSQRQLIRAFAYVVKADILEEQNFFEALKISGFELKAKDLQTFAGGAKKGDWDVGIAIDAITLAPKIDVVVLVTGDGDFLPLVHYLRGTTGCRVEVMAFGKSTSAKLVEEADEFIDMDKNLPKFLLKTKRGINTFNV